MERRHFLQLTAAAGAASLITASAASVFDDRTEAREEAPESSQPLATNEGAKAVIYTVQIQLKPIGLSGLSENQIAQHWKLYEGYITNTNALREELQTLRKDGKGGTQLYADRRRRLGFEYNGMVLHEYYFGNLKTTLPEPNNASPLKKALVEQYGSFDAFKDDFAKAGSSRSIGWVILYLDPLTGAMNNHFVQLHEDGNVTGFAPLLVMDVWEHAYMVDYGASGRPDYIKAFFTNINWQVVEKRFNDAKAGKFPGRAL